MKNLFKNLGADSAFLAGLIVNIITWLVIRFQIKPTSEILPLHYNIFFGVDYSGKGFMLYLMPGLALAILIINYIFYRKANQNQPFAARILAGTGITVQILVLIATLFLKSVIIV